ncbi:VOC family protein [Thalassoglobus polymorphus]|uniref:VOC domain-containing protein n=1 Tax=Thalassoglobus polymorphus TaxID=2527994 RepID=A0A517QPE6_9PLAN|nr:VOC family protein [Thalassoglobus polymorphus]QDT33495.1 hypothetical protein Mal48_27480 [Thalassoglobus polymorphus]
MAVQPIPDGFHSVTPYLIISGASEAIGWYQKTFEATEHLRLDGPGGSVAYAEIRIGNSIVMLADEHPGMGAHGPDHFGGSPTHLMIYVENVDEVFNRAVAAGAEVVRPLQDQFYGDRSGTLKDPFGHQWSIATHIEDLTQEEVDRRFAEMMKG